MVARLVKLWERGAERYGLLGVLRGAQIFFFSAVYIFFDSRDGLGRKGGTASDQIPLVNFFASSEKQQRRMTKFTAL